MAREAAKPAQSPKPTQPRLVAQPARPDGAHRRLSRGQSLALRGTLCLVAALLVIDPDLLRAILYWLLLVGFVGSGLIKLGASLTPPPRAVALTCDDAFLPTYTIIAPLYREAAVAAELLRNLARIDYPHDRLQALIVLEEDDPETRDACLALALPAFVQVLIAPPGAPRTKPRACNVALERARGSLLVIYDAEDAPHPLQLREAAARFAAGPDTLACLQAPLRIDDELDFLRAQFRQEYAVQFEVMLPALARWGLPFPLGGTSNHFRTSALRAVGGWDPYNVTEDADIGFRLAAAGHTLGVITLPTSEPAPQRVADWIPQRGRWIKGHMQTLAVHLRGPASRTPRGLTALMVTLTLSISSSCLHGPIALWGLLNVGALALLGVDPPVAGRDLVIAMFGWSAASIAAVQGRRRAGGSARFRDLVGAIGYWPLQSIAAGRAVWQWIRQPYRWDKTRHAPRTGRALP